VVIIGRSPPIVAIVGHLTIAVVLIVPFRLRKHCGAMR